MNKSNEKPELNELEGLGALLFAFDNQKVNYMELATECANRIKKIWGIPVSVVTDIQDVDYNLWDKRILIPKSEMETNSKVYADYGEDLFFWNSSRQRALELTPYRRTILLDVDYLVQTNDVPRMWDGQDFAICSSAYSVFDYQKLSSDMRVMSERTQIPMSWATIVCFDKESQYTVEFFDQWKKALKGYPVYAHIMGFSPKPVRNDFAVSLALNKMLDGRYQSQKFRLPYAIPSLMPDSSLMDMSGDYFLVGTKDGATTAVYSDLHVMNKKSILECLHPSPTTFTSSTQLQAQAS